MEVHRWSFVFRVSHLITIRGRGTWVSIIAHAVPSHWHVSALVTGATPWGLCRATEMDPFWDEGLGHPGWLHPYRVSADYTKASQQSKGSSTAPSPSEGAVPPPLTPYAVALSHPSLCRFWSCRASIPGQGEWERMLGISSSSLRWHLGDGFSPLWIYFWFYYKDIYSGNKPKVLNKSHKIFHQGCSIH